MKYTTRLAAALGFVGAVALAGVAWGQAGDAPLSDKPVDRPFLDGKGPMRGGPGHGPRHLGHNIVTGSTTFQTDEGLVTKRIDAGDVTAASADSVTIERADGESVTVAVTDDTKVSRDGETATAADLEVGDKAIIHQMDEGDGPVVMGIRALSPEGQAEMEERRAEREAAMEERKAQWEERKAEWEERRSRSDGFRSDRAPASPDAEGASA